MAGQDPRTSVDSEGQTPGQALGQASGQALGQASGQASGQALGQASGQALGQGMLPRTSVDGDVPTSWRARVRPPAPAWAGLELLIAVLVVTAQLRHAIPLDLMVWLSIIAAVCVLWRGPGWRGVGLHRPASVWRTLAIGIAVGLGYQFFSLYVLEPLIAHSTSGVLPDVSAFRSVVGDRHALAFWTAMSWTRAGFAEEAVYRGWLMIRLAELGLFSRSAWIAALLGSSSAFGAMHFYQGWSGTITAGLTGVVLAIVYFVTGRNLWAAVVAHSVMDTAGFVMIYFGLYPGLYTS